MGNIQARINSPHERELFETIDAFKQHYGVLPNDTWNLIQQLNHIDVITDSGGFDEETLDSDQKNIYDGLEWSDRLKWHDSSKAYDHVDLFVEELTLLHTLFNDSNVYRMALFFIKNNYNKEHTLAEYSVWKRAGNYENFNDLIEPTKELVRLLKLLPNGVPSYHKHL